MATLLLAVDCNKDAETMVRNYQRSVSTKQADVIAIIQLLQAIVSGNQPGDGVELTPPSVTVDVQEDMVQANGTFSFASVVNTNTLTINGVVFTAVTSGATGNQFNVGANDVATAVNAAASINASTTALVDGYVTATANVGSLTGVMITSDFYGIAGNQATITGGQSTIHASAGRLTGGTNDSGEKVYTF